MFVLELHTSNLHHALGRLLDQARVANLTLAAVSASAEAGGYRICATLDVVDRSTVDRFAGRIGAIIGIGALEVQSQHSHTGQAWPAYHTERKGSARVM